MVACQARSAAPSPTVDLLHSLHTFSLENLHPHMTQVSGACCRMSGRLPWDRQPPLRPGALSPAVA